MAASSTRSTPTTSSPATSSCSRPVIGSLPTVACSSPSAPRWRRRPSPASPPRSSRAPPASRRTCRSGTAPRRSSPARTSARGRLEFVVAATGPVDRARAPRRARRVERRYRPRRCAASSTTSADGSRSSPALAVALLAIARAAAWNPHRRGRDRSGRRRRGRPARGAAHRRHHHPGAVGLRDGQAQGGGPWATGRRDPRCHVRHLHRQDRHPHRAASARRRGVRRRRPRRADRPVGPCRRCAPSSSPATRRPGPRGRRRSRPRSPCWSLRGTRAWTRPPSAARCDASPRTRSTRPPGG